ncbi:hypothetical protein TrRE_jg4366 [Triparma retinervis]|uniref:Uncharacterized protein n=1 Tax=Triparma retinervis TaxID=2557542 RepID=A0A9W7FBF9_9STRA|nr:hypothetical protein TrRE_jg4366 [Triparma retinervis]
MLAQAGGTFDPIPVGSSMQHPPPNPAPSMGSLSQPPPTNPYGLPPQQEYGGDPGSSFQQRQQQQINQIQHMLMMQQQTLQRITEALPGPGASAGGGGSRGPSPVPNGGPIVKRFKEGEKLYSEGASGKGSPPSADVLMTKAGLQSFIKEYTDMYSDYGKRRLDELTFHLHQLERLVMPQTTTKMGLWTLSQDDKFFEQTARGSLAGILARELQVSAAQMKKIVRILEPVQVIKLLLWVHKNEVELREVCPGWGSEQIIESRN